MEGMSLGQMREELRRKYERLGRERKELEELRQAAKVKPFPPRRESSNPDQIKFPEMIEAEKTGFEKIFNRVSILAEYGKDPEAERLIRKLVVSFFLMSGRDFWTYIYDWTQEAIEFLKERKIKIPL